MRTSLSASSGLSPLLILRNKNTETKNVSHLTKAQWSPFVAWLWFLRAEHPASHDHRPSVSLLNAGRGNQDCSFPGQEQEQKDS